MRHLKKMQPLALYIFVSILPISAYNGLELNELEPADDFVKEIHCNLPPDPGNCNGYYYPVYYYNATSKECQDMAYTGCGGNRNRFNGELQCLVACGSLDFNLPPNQNLKPAAPSFRPAATPQRLPMMTYQTPTPSQPKRPLHQNCYRPADTGCVNFRGSFVVLRYYFDELHESCQPSYYCKSDRAYKGFDNKRNCQRKCEIDSNSAINSGDTVVPRYQPNDYWNMMASFTPAMPTTVTTSTTTQVYQPPQESQGVRLVGEVFLPSPNSCGNPETMASFVDIKNTSHCAEFCEYRPFSCLAFVYNSMKRTCVLKYNCTVGPVGPKVPGDQVYRRTGFSENNFSDKHQHFGQAGPPPPPTPTPNQVIYPPNEPSQVIYPPNEPSQVLYPPNEPSQVIYPPNEPSHVLYPPNERISYRLSTARPYDVPTLPRPAFKLEPVTAKPTPPQYKPSYAYPQTAARPPIRYYYPSPSTKPRYVYSAPTAKPTFVYNYPPAPVQASPPQPSPVFVYNIQPPAPAPAPPTILMAANLPRVNRIPTYQQYYNAPGETTSSRSIVVNRIPVYQQYFNAPRMTTTPRTRIIERVPVYQQYYNVPRETTTSRPRLPAYKVYPTSTPQWLRWVDTEEQMKVGTFNLNMKFRPLGYFCGGDVIETIRNVDSARACGYECSTYKPTKRDDPLCYVFSFDSYQRKCELQVNCYRRVDDERKSWIVR